MMAAMMITILMLIFMAKMMMMRTMRIMKAEPGTCLKNSSYLVTGEIKFVLPLHSLTQFVLRELYSINHCNSVV